MNNDNKIKIILSYIIPIIGFIFYFTEKAKATTIEKQQYAQSATIFCSIVLVNVIKGFLCMFIPFIGLIFNLLTAVIYIFSIVAAVSASKNELTKIPVIYELSIAIFK